MARSAQEFKNCVENRTYNLSETIESASHGFLSRTAKNLSDPGFWTWDMSLPVGGRCYTLNYEANLTMDQEKDSLLFEPAFNRSINVILHEPNFFIPTLNPLTLPTVREPISFLLYKTLTLEVIRWEKINRPEAPCNPSTAIV